MEITARVAGAVGDGGSARREIDGLVQRLRELGRGEARGGGWEGGEGGREDGRGGAAAAAEAPFSACPRAGMGAAGAGEPDPPASAPDPSGSASGRPEEVQTRGEAQLGGERQGRRGRPEVWSTAAAARGPAVERERRRKKERGRGEERRGEMWLTSGPHRNVASTSAKPGSKTARWSKMNGFKGWMVKDIRFWSSMAKIKPR